MCTLWIVLPLQTMAKTRTIGVRSLRANMQKILNEARRDNVHFVIMRFGEPVAHLVPVKPRRKRTMEELEADIVEARRQIARGEWYTTEEVRQMLGLPASKYRRQRNRTSRGYRA